MTHAPHICRASAVRSRGFTLIEVLVTVGIIILLSGLLLSGILIAKKKGTETRARSDLALIGTALEAYKDDFSGQYPTFADPSTDYAVSKANPNGNGLWLDTSQARGAVLLCRALLGPGAASTNPNLSTGDTTASPGDDGADGPGFRVRRNYVGGGQFGGKVYGPYIDSSKFKLGQATPPTAYATYTMAYPVILDVNGGPILYYPAATGNVPNNFPYNDPTMATATSPNSTSPYNGFDNQQYLDAQTTGSPFEKLSGGVWTSTSTVATQNPTWGSQPYLLWTAGLDGKFGLDSNTKSDDITNFDLPANMRK